jgi:Endopolygalacturonase
MNRLLLLSLFFAGLATHIYSQKIRTYSAPDNILQNGDYSVQVRVPGGKWVDLHEYSVDGDMHYVRKSSMVTFDFEGEKVEVLVKCNREPVKTVRIRPGNKDIPYTLNNDSIRFEITNPCNLSVEVNGDIFHNLHIFANRPETVIPSRKDKNLIYIGPGYHTYPKGELKIPSGKTVYLAGGAVVNAKLLCDSVQNVRICGRGILYHGERGVEITNSKNITLEDLIVINPVHYTVFGGQSTDLTIRNIRSFSAKGWADGIDLMSCSNVLVDGAFLRTSDDCIALYCHRWKYYGDCRNVTVRNSVLWADVAHPIMIGTHGNPEPGKAEEISDLTFSNIDILNHDEPQINYQGCIAINVSDQNLARNIRFEDIRIDDFEQGQLLNLRVTFNKKYALAPGRGIENILFKNVRYNGSNSNLSIIEGYDSIRSVRNVTFENLEINGKEISPKLKKPGYMDYCDFARIYKGNFVDGVTFISEENTSSK